MTDPVIYQFTQQQVAVHTDDSLEDLLKEYDPSRDIILTDYHIYANHHKRFGEYRVIKVPPGEQHKNFQSLNSVIEQLIGLEAGKNATLIAVGGGVLTDLAGLTANIYKRGIRLVLVPTTILGMVDAAIGGKNGINQGMFKNMIGTICQPEKIVYDFSLLQSLPGDEWVNGFAEIIKHACIRDKLLFQALERYNLHDFQSDLSLTSSIIEKNIRIKMDIVTHDEHEAGERKLLNFGHTIGHAIENLHQLPHGHAISIGMVAASNLSVRLGRLHFEEAARLVRLLAKYHLPVDIETDYQKVMQAIRQDKKRADDTIHFILPDHVGSASIVPVTLSELEAHINHIL